MAYFYYQQNGKAKSTLLKIILGIIDNYEGYVKYNDYEFGDITTYPYPKIFYIGDRPFIVDDTLKITLVYLIIINLKMK